MNQQGYFSQRYTETLLTELEVLLGRRGPSNGSLQALTPELIEKNVGNPRSSASIIATTAAIEDNVSAALKKAEQVIYAAVNASRLAAEAAATASSTAQSNAEAAQALAETAASASQTSATNAAASENAASGSATAASDSASLAAAHATDAGTQAAAAQTARVAAETARAGAEVAESRAATSETNAASSAATASQQATLAADSATAAGQSASAASDSATVATTKATEASQSASAATSAKNTAETAAGQASASAASAAISEQDASQHVAQAQQSAQAAAASETAAGNSATAAATSQQNAATSATNAAGSASQAAQSQTLSADSQWFAFNERAKTSNIQYTMTAEADEWMGGLSASLRTQPGPVVLYPTILSHQVTAEDGAVLRSTGGAYVTERVLRPVVAGQKWTVDWGRRVIVNKPSGNIRSIVYLVGHRADGSYRGLTVVDDWSAGQTMVDGYVTRSKEFDPAALITAVSWTDVTQWRLTIRLLISETGETVDFGPVNIRNVSEVVEAAGHASASASSATAAASSADAAGQSATAASQSKLSAETAAGTASIKATEAASSATTAAGHASTAATNSTLAVSAKTAAEKAALSSQPTTFEDDGLYFCGDASSGLHLPVRATTFQTVGGVREGQNTVSTYGYVGQKSVRSSEAGRKWKVRALIRHVSGTPKTAQLRLEQFNSNAPDAVRAAVLMQNTDTITSASATWIEHVFTAGAYPFVSAGIVTNHPGTATAVQGLQALELIDVTESEAAESAAGVSTTKAAEATGAAAQAVAAQSVTARLSALSVSGPGDLPLGPDHFSTVTNGDPQTIAKATDSAFASRLSAVTSTDPEVGGRDVRATGHVPLYTIQAFPIDTARKYRIRARVKREAYSSGNARLFLGHACLGPTYATVGANSGRLYSVTSALDQTGFPVGGFVEFLSGIITGEAGNALSFHAGTKSIRLIALLNEADATSGNIMRLSLLELIDVTDDEAIADLEAGVNFLQSAVVGPAGASATAALQVSAGSAEGSIKLGAQYTQGGTGEATLELDADNIKITGTTAIIDTDQIAIRAIFEEQIVNYPRNSVLAAQIFNNERIIFERDVSLASDPDPAQGVRRPVFVDISGAAYFLNFGSATLARIDFYTEGYVNGQWVFMTGNTSAGSPVFLEYRDNPYKKEEFVFRVVFDESDVGASGYDHSQVTKIRVRARTPVGAPYTAYLKHYCVRLWQNKNAPVDLS